MKKMKLVDIKISESFKQTVPKEEKMQKCRNHWNENHHQDRYIVVNNNNVLIDGYIQYLVLKENGIEDAEIILKHHSSKNKMVNSSKLSCRLSYKNRNTTYIYGIHPNSDDTKERVWRVPNSWVGWENDLLPGDKILVRTKHGVAPIIITKIDWLNKCPVNGKV